MARGRISWPALGCGIEQILCLCVRMSFQPVECIDTVMCYAGTSLMDLPEALLLKIVSGKSLRAICRKGRAAANRDVRRIQVRRGDQGAVVDFR